MNLISSLMAIIGLTTLVVVYLIFASKTAFEGISLPCMTVITSGIYFYLMPGLVAATGKLEAGFFGMYIDSLIWPHFAVFLYTLGALGAFMSNRRRLAVNSAKSRHIEHRTNWTIFYLLCALAAAVVTAQVMLGRLNFTREIVAGNFSDLAQSLRFLNLFFTMLVPLTLVYLIKTDFSLRSLVLTAIITLILLQVGFRYRIIFLVFSVFASWMIIRGLKIRTSYVVLGSTAGLFLTNFLVNVRTYGAGLDLTQLEGMSFTDIFQSFGGEIGPIYVINHVASNPLPDIVYFEPWIVGIARLVPTFLWPEKPTADYLLYYSAGFSEQAAEKAGIAAPQQVELLLQFGWIGLPILAFIYFYFAAWLLSRINRLSREARIAGASLIPIFFGFYMQTRGYFFQTLSDGLFLFGPLFLMQIGGRKPRSSRPCPSPTDAVRAVEQV